MADTLYISLLLLVCPSVHVAASSGTTDLSWQDYVNQEIRLRDEKITYSNYSNKIRPSHLVNVHVRYNLLSINSLDIKAQTFSTSGWLTVKWQDLRLAWTPRDFNNISYMFDTDAVLWRPELIFDNSVDNIGIISDDALLMRVRYDGEVMWEPPGIHTVHCEIDTTYYPFDSQRCVLELASWAYNIAEVNLSHLSTAVNQQDYAENGEWDLRATTLLRHELVEEEETFSQLQFVFHLHRRPIYYAINIMLPIGLTSVLSIIVFILPFESGEKVSYALTVLLSYAVLMTIVASNMPSTSTLSVLAIYLALILFVGCTSTILSVINLYIYHQQPETPIPKSLRRFVDNFLLKVTCWGRDTSDNKPDQDLSPSERVATKVVYPVMMKHGESAPVYSSPVHRSGSRQKIVPVDYSPSRTQPADGDSRRPEKAWGKKEDGYTWVDIAIMMDKFLFRFYLVFVTLATLVFFIILPVGGYFLPSAA